jgi:signal peptidase II
VTTFRSSRSGRRPVYPIALAAAVLGLAADQGSKWALLEIVGLRGDPRTITIAPFFDIVLWWNNGTSFSLFRTGEAWGPYVFSIAALAIIVFLVLWLGRTASPVLAAAIGAVIGGALGNVVDRLRFGAVADFFYAHIGDYGWPAFNVADSLIVMGVGVLVFDGMFLGRRTPDKMGQRDKIVQRDRR